MMTAHTKNLQSSNNIANDIRHALRSTERFAFLGRLQNEALTMNSATWTTGLKPDALQIIAMQKQFERIDAALVSTLEKEGRLRSYLEWDRDDDPDLPEEPDSLTDPKVAYKYALMRLYRLQFEVTVNERKSGCWPLIEFDLLEPIDGSRTLLIDTFPEAVSQHPSSNFIASMPLERLRQIQQTYSSVARAIEDQKTSTPAKGSMTINPGEKDLNGKIYELIYNYYCQADDTIREICALNEKVKQAEAHAKAEAERKSVDEYHARFGKEPREIPHASDYVDHFERNQERVSRSC